MGPNSGFPEAFLQPVTPTLINPLIFCLLDIDGSSGLRKRLRKCGAGLFGIPRDELSPDNTGMEFTFELQF